MASLNCIFFPNYRPLCSRIVRFSVLNSFYSKCISSLPQPILYTIRPKVNNDPRICLQSCRRNDKSSLASKSIFADSDGYERRRRNGFLKKSKLKMAFLTVLISSQVLTDSKLPLQLQHTTLIRQLRKTPHMGK